MTFEGGEGVGKSTQIERLAKALRATGQQVITTREPGGSDGAEAIRALVAAGGADRWAPDAELFLFIAARADHLRRTVRPAVEAGSWVLCDRFWDSTRVYQGFAGGLPLAAIDRLHEDWLRPFRPSLTLLLDQPAEVGLTRAEPGRFEAKGAAFHQQVRQGFLTLAERETERFRVIDAAADKDSVAASIWDTVRQRWPEVNGR